MIRHNLEHVRERIADAASRAGRDYEDVTLIAISKTFTADIIEEVIANGVTDIGENKIQEAESKYATIGNKCNWHFVGHLQTNKVKKALPIFHLIHSLDRISLAESLQKRVQIVNKTVDVLVQVNTSGESSKFGISPEHVLAFIENMKKYQNIRIKGLMTIGSFLSDPDGVRPEFVKLADLKKKIEDKIYDHVEMQYLSMGMTSDFEVAIEEGANLVRLGTAIFGKRTYKAKT